MSETTTTSSATGTTTKANDDPLETARWTKYLPQAFGIREAVRKSSYRWCVREGGMWGIATATAMSLHRMRMGTSPRNAGHVFFGTFMLVMWPSYYFCYRRRDHQEQVIEAMMKYNQFGHAADMPAETPLEEHPFWEKGTTQDATQHESEFRGMIKERKEWQKKEDKSFEDIFNERR